jgi:Galactose oxidase, central domain/Kelch motif
MSEGRQKQQATRLNNGRVLITGGQGYLSGAWTIRQSADLFDGNGNFIASLNMTIPRAEHTATLLNDGRVLIVGGWTNGPGSVAEIYDPSVGANGSFTASAAVIPGFAWPSQHTATLLTTGPHAGQVLIAGGWGSPTLGASYFYDPVSNTFSNAPALLTRRLDHAATRLPNGVVVFSGGVTDATTYISTPLIEMYDPATGEQAYLGNMITDRNTHSADLVSTPSGPRLAIAGGYGSAILAGRTIELFDLGDSMGSFVAAAPMTQARRGHVAVQLNNDKVLLAGSDQFNVSGAELYDPSTNTTVATGNLVAARCNGCAYAKLLNGKVLITGGWNGGPVLNTAEIYDPATGLFSATAGNMTGSRLEHSAVLLDNGKVLILGGYDGTTPYASAELFDPATGLFTATGSMSSVRYRATPIKLTNGKVLVIGGFSTGSNVVTTAELYDPVAGTFSPTGSMVSPRLTEAPVLLDDGRVLVAGGWNGVVMAQAEVYNPGTGTFSVVGSMTTSRSGHFEVKLQNGVVVVGGGSDQSGTALNSAEMFNPATNTFTKIADLPSARVNSRAILLSDGRIMITGGTSTAGTLVNSVDYYVP